MRYKSSPGVIVASMCDSHYLVTADMTIMINETAAYYWTKLMEGTDEDGLVSWVREKYEIEDEQALRTGIRDFLESMLAKRLLVRCDI